MDENFIRAWEGLLKDETGAESRNDPSRRNHVYGVARDTVGKWLDGAGGGSLRGEGPSTGELQRLFHEKLWIVLSCNLLPAGVDYFVFDCGVRFSPGDSTRWLRLASEAGDPLVEPTPGDVIRRMDVFVRRRLKSDPRWEEYKHWWTNRANRARDRALKMVNA